MTKNSLFINWCADKEMREKKLFHLIINEKKNIIIVVDYNFNRWHRYIYKKNVFKLDESCLRKVKYAPRTNEKLLK